MRRRWLLGLGFALPLAGILVALLLPPFDEYAALSRLGSEKDDTDSLRRLGEDGAPKPYTLESAWSVDAGLWMQCTQGDWGRLRHWEVTVPDAQAEPFMSRFARPSLGWRITGTGTSGPTNKPFLTMYTNDETGDQLIIQYASEIHERTEVRLTQSKSSLGPWAKVKRWFHLTLTR